MKIPIYPVKTGEPPKDIISFIFLLFYFKTSKPRDYIALGLVVIVTTNTFVTDIVLLLYLRHGQARNTPLPVDFSV